MSASATSTRASTAVVGGGIVGLAIARELLLRRAGESVVVLEKERSVGAHQTTHNSGVVHAGIYYPPGTLKAELSARGRSMLREYCLEHGLPYSAAGKAVVAVHPAETLLLDRLEERATANRVPGLRRIGSRELREIEPHVAGVAALYSPGTAITDFAAVARSLAEEVVALGGEIRLGTEVTGLRRTAGQLRVRLRHRGETREETFGSAILCPGLYADRAGRWADGQSSPRIIPFRGEYLMLAEHRAHLVRGLVYPIPDPRYPFLGVHFTKRIDGRVDIGPNAVLALHRQGYRRRDVSLRDTWELLTWPGFWKLAGAHWRTGMQEFQGSMSAETFLRAARRYLPALTAQDVTSRHAGVRAQAVARDGSMVDDFLITQTGPITAVRNAPSPAATSSLAIAEHVVSGLVGGY